MKGRELVETQADRTVQSSAGFQPAGMEIAGGMPAL